MQKNGLENLPEKLGEQIRSLLPAILFGACFLMALVAKQFELDSSRADLFVLVSAAVATLLVIKPFQNVIGLAVTIAIFSGLIFLGENILKMPCVVPVLNDDFRQLPRWTSPLLWIIALVNARGVSKLFLHKIRRTKNFGLWLLALSSLLVACMNSGAHFHWQRFSLQFALAMIAFVATTPWFIDKKPFKHAPDYQPLIITILLFCW